MSATHSADFGEAVDHVLTAGGKTLSTAPNRLGYLQPTDPKLPLAELRERLRETGYLWLKGLLPSEDVLAFRGWLLGHLAETGMIMQGSDPRLGLASPGSLDKAQADRRLMSLVRSARYEAFCAQRPLSAFMDELLGGISYLHRRKLLRYTLPGSSTVTPAHYDLVYLRGGTDRLVTAWVPIGDIPAQMGGLVYLEGSHALGLEMEAEFTAKAADLSAEERISAYNRNMAEGGWISKDLPAMAERFNARWLFADYEAGDVVLHSPYMIHASTANQDGQGRIRLSTDIRYQNVDDEIDARWNNHWSLDDML